MHKALLRLISVVISLSLALGSNFNAYAAANVYYISATGNDANAGTSSAPFRTIQKCLNVVTAGNTCLITAGTYNEALTLKTSGTVSSPITIKCATSKGCTVNSGNSKTLVSGGRVDYYIIEGIRFIASYTPASQIDASIELSINIPWSRTSKTAGNHGFIFRDCYIEGAIHFYGHNNLMEGCELNGKNVWSNGLMDDRPTSYNNIYRNNLIYNYKIRGIWTMEATDNILVEGNTIHNIQHGIDCDGAGISVSRCKVINNNVYNVGISQWGSGIFLENCFDCLVQGNTVHDIQNGSGIYAINYGNGGETLNWHTFNNIEYRSRNSNTSIIKNVIYNYRTSAGLYVTSVIGLVIDHNTFYNVGTPPAIGFHTEKDGVGVSYPPKDETITNNIFLGGGVKWFNPTTGLISAGNFSGDPLFVNPVAADFHLRSSSPACTSGMNGAYIGAFPCGAVAPTLPPANTQVVPSSTPSMIPSMTPTAQIPTLTFTPTPVPMTATPTTSPVPAFPTVTASLLPATPTLILPSPPIGSETIYDDKDGAFVYSSGWHDISKSKGQPYNGSYKLTTQNGSFVTFTFSGQSFSVLYKGGPTLGQMDVYVDDVLVGSIDEKTENSSFQQRWDYTGQLTPEPHALKLVFVASNKTQGSIDAVIVRQ